MAREEYVSRPKRLEETSRDHAGIASLAVKRYLYGFAGEKSRGEGGTEFILHQRNLRTTAVASYSKWSRRARSIRNMLDASQ